MTYWLPQEVMWASGRNNEYRRSLETEKRGIQPSTTLIDHPDEAPYTSVKTVPRRGSDEQKAGQVDIPRRTLRTREASQEDAMASARHFFVSINGQNQVVTSELPEGAPTVATGSTTLTPTPAVTIYYSNYFYHHPQLLRLEVLECFFQKDHLLDPMQQLPVDHKHGCAEFQKVGQMSLPQMALIPERVVYLSLHYW